MNSDPSGSCRFLGNMEIKLKSHRCRFMHDIPAYLTAKPHDLHIPQMSEMSDLPPYAPSPETLRKSHPEYPTLDLNTVCPVFAETGECRYGFKCRFLGGHVKFSETGELSLVGDEDKKARAALTAHEVNFVGADVQRMLRSKKVCVFHLFFVNKVLTSIKVPNTNLGPVSA